MNSENTESRFTLAMTESSLGKLPPELRVATGHDEEVMLFLLRVGDAKLTTETLMEVIALSETEEILATLAATPGLIRKRFHIDDAFMFSVQVRWR